MSVLHAAAEHLDLGRLGPAQHVGISEEEGAEHDGEEGAEHRPAQPATGRHGDIGEGPEQEGEADEG